ncbi:hypothetical protein BASA50_008965 [Batrachochytrium salamandrivorans]|uniref:ABC transporter domain-containing protein n=1 Tax=Batrachochytrium salamandrivorans TaxID=1357716 RepID=A0ABQ8F2F8_9FUNG|nr:hypothetical protein BASA62_007380 [Batrachochytrium salamandrivorans]KAH6590965.1 hypothetical protein BASA50_008965 [Batrachochytrium salamandrivorans]KAH9268566.1 hypothetical protein BASA84_000171 [Batrachochytrium salamandrivorans]KAJ1343290.1 hypothetical protein BSLG_002316 [Batrachochytrium salamandrivorans]
MSSSMTGPKTHPMQHPPDCSLTDEVVAMSLMSSSPAAAAAVTNQLDKTNQEDFQLSSKASHGRQLFVLVKKVILIKLRDRASTLVSVLTPIFILFILFILNISLSTSISAPKTAPLGTLSSNCPSGTAKTLCVSLGYTNTSQIDDIISSLSGLVLAAEPEARIVYYTTKDAIVSARNINPQHFIIGIEFVNVSDLATSTTTPSISYNILSNNTVISSFDDVRIDTASAYVQTAILNVFRAKQGLPSLRSPLYPNNGSPLLATIRGKATSGVSGILPYYFVYMLQPLLQVLLASLAKEKAEKTKSGLLMIGTNGSMYMLATLIGNTVFNIITVFLIVLIVCLGGIFKYSSPVLLFIIIFLYIIATALVGCILSVIISSPLQVSPMSFLTTIFGLVLFAVSQIYVWKLNNLFVEHLVLLIAPVALARVLALTMDTESHAIGFTYQSMSDVHFAAPFYMLIVDIALYWLLAWYFDKIFPGENNGTPQQWNFPLKSSFWTPAQQGTEAFKLYKPETTPSQFVEDFDITHIPEANRNVLSVNAIVKEFKVTNNTSTEGSDGLIRGILRNRARASTKPSTIKRAVSNFNIDLHSDQIVALLGHNGAGKTTLISMITGIVQPTSGHIYVRPRSSDLFLDIADPLLLPVFSPSLGVCPQFDVLFDTLTVREHLVMYIGIKGICVDGRVGNGSGIDNGSGIGTLEMQYVEAMARDVELYAKLDAYASTLSGGMKRKLSVAIALLGSPRVVLLDEPTTGMDVDAQQRVWSLIRCCKKDKVVILTTHSMEEAEVLGDRIAIMSNGTLKTLGTSIFLKDQFGTGYSIDFSKTSSASVSSIISAQANSQILAFVQRFFPGAQLEPETSSSSISVLLAKDQKLDDVDRTTPPTQFAEFYNGLQSAITDGELGSLVESVRLDLTTLEQVFLRFKDNEEASS